MPSFFDNTLEIINPIQNQPKVTTIGQLKEVHRITQEIIENLDHSALNQLFGGSNKDLDKIMSVMMEETYRVLYGDLGIIKDSTLMYLDRLSEVVEETMRIENINYFISSCMPEFELNWHHLEWGQYVMRYNKFAVLAARDLGKSYYFSNAYPIWKMYRYRPPNRFSKQQRPDLTLSHRGFIVTNSEDLGIDLLEILKGNIESNPELSKKLMPEGEAKAGWGQKSIRCSNNARLGIKSYGSSFRGRHPGYIVVDDFLKDNVIYSEVQRTKAINWFHSVLMNALSKNGQVPVVGTPFHERDLYGDLKDKKGWKVFEYPAIFPNGTLAWENRYNYAEIMAKRDEQGNLIFSREILVRPIVSDSSIFPYEILKRAFIGMQDYILVNNRESFKTKFTHVVVGCDFAMSSSTGADASVFTVWGVTEAQELWLMYFWRGIGKSYFEQVAVLKQINMNFRPDVMVLEANQFQQIFVETADAAGLPVVPHVTTGQNKHDLKSGLPGVAILFERMKIRFPRGDQHSIDVSDFICGEFASIAFTDKGLESVGAHDDCAMSTWLGSTAMKRLTFGILGFLED